MRMSRRDPRYKFPKETRKIGGKVYKYLMWSKTKEESEKDVRRLSKQHPNEVYKVVRSQGGWAIYYRKR